MLLSKEWIEIKKKKNGHVCTYTEDLKCFWSLNWTSCKILDILSGIWSQIVSTEPATVDVPKESIEVKVGDTASLECFGSNPSLSYYIKNR